MEVARWRTGFQVARLSGGTDGDITGFHLLKHFFYFFKCHLLVLKGVHHHWTYFLISFPVEKPPWTHRRRSARPSWGFPARRRRRLVGRPLRFAGSEAFVGRGALSWTRGRGVSPRALPEKTGYLAWGRKPGKKRGVTFWLPSRFPFWVASKSGSIVPMCVLFTCCFIMWQNGRMAVWLKFWELPSSSPRIHVRSPYPGIALRHRKRLCGAAAL